MQTCESRSFSEEEVASLANNSESDKEGFTEFALLLDKFTPILIELKENGKVMDRPPVRAAVDSLENELRRAKELIKSTGNSKSPIKQMEYMTQDLGRSLGLVLFASIDVSREIKEKVSALHKELMSAKFITSLSTSPCPSPRPSQEYGSVSEMDSEREIEEETVTLSTEDVVLQLKYGNDEEFKLALWGLRDIINDQSIDKEWINNEGVIPILFNRLGSSKPRSRLTIIQMLRILASVNTENKVTHMRIDCFYL